MQRGERYALIPRDVMESDAYRALPDWCVRVLVALAVQYYGSRNGSLALPVAEAQRLGVRQPWRLYAGLRILEAAELIVCTRRGHLSRGTRHASVYAITWKQIDEPAAGITYDAGVSVGVHDLPWPRAARSGARRGSVGGARAGESDARLWVRSRRLPHSAPPLRARAGSRIISCVTSAAAVISTNPCRLYHATR